MWSLEALRVFTLAADSISFTEAAGKLRLSVPTVSRTIGKLEEDLRVRLFSRNTRHLTLTEAGHAFLADVRKCIEHMDAAIDRLARDRDMAAGQIRAVLASSFCKNYVMRELASFMDENPNISVDIQVEDYPRDLLAEGYEIAVQYERPTDGNYIYRSLGKMRIILAASPAYLQRYGVPRTIADLDRHHCIAMRASVSGAPFQWPLVPTGARRDRDEVVVYQPKGRLFINSQLDTTATASLGGVGIGPIDLGAARKYLESGDLKIVLPDYQVFAGNLYLLYADRSYMPKKMRIFIDFLVDLAGRTLSEPFDAHAFAA